MDLEDLLRLLEEGVDLGSGGLVGIDDLLELGEVLIDVEGDVGHLLLGAGVGGRDGAAGLDEGVAASLVLEEGVALFLELLALENLLLPTTPKFVIPS